MGPLLGGSVAHLSRYLGSLLHFREMHNADVTARLRAADVSWHSYRGFWTSAPKAFAIQVFKSVVANTAYTNLDFRPLGKQQLDRIDSRLAKYARVVLRGAAHSLSADGAHHAWSTVQVLAAVKLAPAVIELRVRRLQMLASMLRHRDCFEQLFAALFGASFLGPQVSSDHFLLDTATSYAKMFMADIDSLRSIEELAPLASLVAGQPRNLFSAPVREFLDRCVDWSVIRQKHLHEHCPFSSLLRPEPTATPIAVPVELDFVCRVALDDGTECGRSFASRQQLAMHQVSAQYGSHRRFITSLLAITNQCPICLHTFASKRGVRTHLLRSFVKDYCRIGSAANVYPVEKPVSLTCPLCCGDPFDDLSCLHSHLRWHLPHIRAHKSSALDCIELDLDTPH
jgi:hypothetical protein